MEKFCKTWILTSAADKETQEKLMIKWGLQELISKTIKINDTLPTVRVKKSSEFSGKFYIILRRGLHRHAIGPLDIEGTPILSKRPDGRLFRVSCQLVDSDVMKQTLVDESGVLPIIEVRSVINDQGEMVVREECDGCTVTATYTPYNHFESEEDENL